MAIATATMAAWTLLIRMHAANTVEIQKWNRNYYPYSTPQECEMDAKRHWKMYYDTYGNLYDSYLYPLKTTCQAETVKHIHYAWLITCDKSGNCTKQTFEGKY